MKIDVFIEKGLDSIYDVHFGEQTKGLTFGFLRQGKTVKEAIDDFYNSRDEIKAHYQETASLFRTIWSFYSNMIMPHSLLTIQMYCF